MIKWYYWLSMDPMYVYMVLVLEVRNHVVEIYSRYREILDFFIFNAIGSHYSNCEMGHAR